MRTLHRSLIMLSAVVIAFSGAQLAFAQPGGGGAGMLMRQAGLKFGLLQQERVLEELKVDDDQKDLINDFLQEAEGTVRERIQDAMGGGRPGRQMTEAMEELAAEMRKWENERLKELLDDEQLQRLQQISWQVRGASALLDEELAEKLDLKPEQRTRVQQKLRENQEQLRELMAEMRENPQEARQRMQEIRTSLDRELIAILDDGQKEKLEELKGEPFEMPQQRPERRQRRPDF